MSSLTNSPIRYLLEAKSIAIIGASRHPGKIGYVIVKNLKEYGFQGKIYPVNPNADEILGLKCYKSILEIPDQVDVAVISVPAQLVPQVLDECGKKGVKVAVIISSGFKEVGNVELEEKIVEIARSYGMRILGPNIFGYVYTPKKINATFGPKDVIPGNIAFISQSGALGIALMGWTILEEIGLSAIFSVGNKADIDDADLLELLKDDPYTKVILIYMEGITHGRKFIEVARKVSLEKPIIVVKAGRSEKGAKAAASHTGSMAGTDAIYSTVFKQCGILRAISIEEAFDWARALANLPEPKGENIVIITNGGGVGVLATDACEELGLHLMDMPQDLMDEFRKYMPPFGSPKNPIDLTGQATENDYRGALEVAFRDDRIHAIIVLYCHTAITNPMNLAKIIVEVVDKYGKSKPIVTSLVGGTEVMEAIRYLNRHGVPSYPTPERAVSSLAALYRWHRWRQKELSRVKAIKFISEVFATPTIQTQ